MVFDSRDPAARGWEAWNPLNSRKRVKVQGGAELTTWVEVTEVSGELVTFVHHYAFSDSEDELLSRSTLRFRSETTLRSSLRTAGFDIEAIYGGWQREPVGQGDGEFIVVARALCP